MKICFVAPGIYPSLNPEKGIAMIGGAELQQIFIGRGLKRRGITVSYMTTDHGQPDRELIDGMTIFKSYRDEEGIRGLRFFYPRLVRIWHALRRADADVYYCRSAGFLPGLLALFCRFYRKKFIYAGAHDTDFIPGKELIRFSRDRFLYQRGLWCATAIIVQSTRQNELLWNNYRLKGTIIRNFFEGKVLSNPLNDKNEILWVSTIRKWKRPLLFIELARAFPEERFVMIGGPDHSNRALYDEVKNECAVLPNIVFLGFQSFENTEKYFDRCKLFVNTSLYEGFPNTFLQAWRRGIPVVSYIDPDGLIGEHRLGCLVHSAEGMAQAVAELLHTYQTYQSGITRYFIEHHSDRVIERYVSLFEELCHAA